MRVFGVDFTSAPGPRKGIICASGHLEDDRLVIDSFLRFNDFTAFEAFLATTGPWIAGFDFPFGQPRRLIQNLNWPVTWSGYIQVVGQMDKADFSALLAAYRAARQPGDRHHLRAVDRLAGAVSPMMMAGVPVGKMFFEGAPRLLRAGISVQPCRPAQADRVAVEAYPALVTRRLGVSGYKNDDRRKQTPEQANRRCAVLAALCDYSLTASYGLHIRLTDEIAAAAASDPAGDHLDAVLCALQAGWAWSQQDKGWGIPPDADTLEGWIADPMLLE